jgi:hypothetical protein
MGSFAVWLRVRIALSCASCDAATQSADLVDVVDTIWLLSEDELIKVSPEGGGSERLLAVLTLLVLGGMRLACSLSRVVRGHRSRAVDHG